MMMMMIYVLHPKCVAMSARNLRRRVLLERLLQEITPINMIFVAAIIRSIFVLLYREQFSIS